MPRPTRLPARTPTAQHLLLVHQDTVVVLATGVTASTRVATVLAWTTTATTTQQSSSPKPHRRQPRRPDTSHHCHAAQMPCSSERSQRCIFTGSRTVYGPASNGSSGAQAHAGSRPYAGMQALWCVTSPCGTHRHDHDRRRCVLFSFGSSSFGRPEYITRRSGGERSETRAGSEHARHDATTGWGAPCRLIATAAVAATPPPGRRHSHKTCT